MALPTSNKILPKTANCNSTEDDSKERALTATQQDLGLAVAKPHLIKGGLKHVSIEVRRILARATSKVRE